MIQGITEEGIGAQADLEQFHIMTMMMIWIQDITEESTEARVDLEQLHIMMMMRMTMTATKATEDMENILLLLAILI